LKAQWNKQQQADLIVIGTHGRTGLSHMMLGSVAERVVRTSEVPVLTIRSAS
jgi:nucleotide-binding universal stress UspA family protein